VGRVGTLTPHGRVPGNRETGRGHQLDQLIDRIRIVAPPADNTNEKGPNSAFGALAVDLEDAQVPGSGVIVTARAGTTVEMACL
jgi:hypothetical protein